jgi:hypothetical protein
VVDEYTRCSDNDAPCIIILDSLKCSEDYLKHYSNIIREWLNNVYQNEYNKVGNIFNMDTIPAFAPTGKSLSLTLILVYYIIHFVTFFLCRFMFESADTE